MLLALTPTIGPNCLSPGKPRARFGMRAFLRFYLQRAASSEEGSPSCSRKIYWRRNRACGVVAPDPSRKYQGSNKMILTPLVGLFCL